MNEPNMTEIIINQPDFSLTEQEHLHAFSRVISSMLSILGERARENAPTQQEETEKHEPDRI